MSEENKTSNLDVLLQPSVAGRFGRRKRKSDKAVTMSASMEKELKNAYNELIKRPDYDNGHHYIPIENTKYVEGVSQASFHHKYIDTLEHLNKTTDIFSKSIINRVPVIKRTQVYDDKQKLIGESFERLLEVAPKDFPRSLVTPSISSSEKQRKEQALLRRDIARTNAANHAQQIEDLERKCLSYGATLANLPTGANCTIEALENLCRNWKAQYEILQANLELQA